MSGSWSRWRSHCQRCTLCCSLREGELVQLSCTVCVHVRVRTCLCACVHVHVSMHAHVYRYYACVHACLHVCMCVSMRLSMRACMCASKKQSCLRLMLLCVRAPESGCQTLLCAP